MTNLLERLGAEPTRAKVIEECVALIDSQVKSKGMVIRASYATVKAIKRGFVSGVVNALLDDWLAKLQPHHDRWASGGSGSFADFLVARSDEVSEDLLAVTDKRAENTTHTTAKKLYVKMRPSAKINVIEALPELSKLIERHLTAAAA